MVIRVYWASVTGNRKVNGDQTRLRFLIESLKLESTWIDITTSRAVCNQMRMECGDPKALPPQIFNDDIHLGNVEDMDASIEDGRLMEWLRMEDPKPKEENEEGKVVQATANDTASAPVEVDAPTEGEAVAKTVNTSDNPDYSKSEAIVVSKSVSSAVNAFEELQKSPKVSKKTIQLEFSKDANNSNNHVDTGPKMDEDRRRRILGLPPLNADESPPVTCLQDKTNNIAKQNGVKETDHIKVKTFQSAKITTTEYEETAD